MENIIPDSIPLVFNTAQKKMDLDQSRESLEQAFIRYFKETSCTVTLPLVGTQYYSWNAAPEVLDRLCDNLAVDDLLCHAEKIRRAKPMKMRYGSALASISPQNIVMQVTV